MIGVFVLLFTDLSQACRVRAWSPGKWNPTATTDLTLLLSEFADPSGEATQLKVPDPNADTLIEDELIQPAGSGL